MADRKRTAKRETPAAPPPFSLSTGWAGVILALLVVLFFNAVIVGGKTFVSPDTTQPAGFVRIGEQSLYHDHVYPLWNPFVFLGMPSFASGAYNPLMLWLASRWMRRGGPVWLGWLALAGGFQMLRGHVQVCFYTWVAIGIYSAIEWLAALRHPVERVRSTARLCGLAAAAALAFGIAGFYNLPLRDYARYSIRGTGGGGGVGMDYATPWSPASSELPSFVVPGWVGFGGSTYWGGMPFTDYPNGYIGIVA